MSAPGHIGLMVLGVLLLFLEVVKPSDGENAWAEAPAERPPALAAAMVQQRTGYGYG